jgi:hypothetical protein
MSSEFRPDREEAFNHAISQVLGIILNFVIVITAFEHHDRSPGNNNGKDNFDIRAKTQQAGTDGNENPLKTMAPMIPQYRTRWR